MKKLWLIKTALIISTLLVNVISADTQPTYIELQSGQTNLYITTTNYYKSVWVDTNNVRIINRITSNGNYYGEGLLVSTTPFTYNFASSRNDWPNITSGVSTSVQYTINGNTYYYGSIGMSNNTEPPTIVTEIPRIRDDTFGNNDAGYKQFAIYYTYGEGAVGPQPQIIYGSIPIEYSQNLFTETPQNNLDIIRWYGTQDNNGNDLSNVNLEIQAVAGYFQGSSYADLKTSTFSDWQASTHPAVQMFYGNYVDYHSQEYRWGDVATEFRSINTLGTWFWNIFASENTWYQYGWRYRYRLCDENDEPLTEWEFIYTGNSYSPDATEILTDPEEPLNPDTVETINDINNENNTVNNWYINNTVINNNEYNQTYQQNIIQNIYNVLTGTPDPEKHQKATDVQQTIDNAIDTEDDYLNDLSSQLTDLELPDISEQTGLLKALRWVREVHKETIEETLLAPIVLVILTIGLITYLIGRRNG